jgi:hypothetical protein
LVIKKPVLIRSNFINEFSLLDDLDLEDLIEVEFRKESQKGKDADLIYVDVSEYPNAYKLGGLYEQVEGQILIKVNLFQDEKLIKTLNIKPTDDPERLVKILMREVKKVLKGELD